MWLISACLKFRELLYVTVVLRLLGFLIHPAVSPISRSTPGCWLASIGWGIVRRLPITNLFLTPGTNRKAPTKANNLHPMIHTATSAFCSELSVRVLSKSHVLVVSYHRTVKAWTHFKVMWQWNYAHVFNDGLLLLFFKYVQIKNINFFAMDKNNNQDLPKNGDELSELNEFLNVPDERKEEG